MDRHDARMTDPLAIDPAATVADLTRRLRAAIAGLGRRGAVVAVSGGIDSSVVAALCVRAVGPEHVLCLSLPERESEDASAGLAAGLCSALGARGRGAHHGRARGPRVLPAPRRRDPRGPAGLPARLAAQARPLRPDRRDDRLLPGGGAARRQREERRGCRRRVPCALAATNMKQRVRKLLEYTWADRLGYAVIGTPNLLEYDQGFFVKGGDGLADVKPIARLYKRQVFALGRELGLPEAIARAHADDGHVQPPADAGGVLLRAPPPTGWISCCGARRRCRHGRAGRDGRHGRGGRRGGVLGAAAPARGHPPPPRAAGAVRLRASRRSAASRYGAVGEDPPIGVMQRSRRSRLIAG